MGGFDDHVGIIGDWMPPSPSPRSFFLGMLGDDPGSRPPKDDDNHTTGFTFPGPNRPIGSENGDGIRATNEPTKPGAFGEPKTGSRAGLVERMAARAGYNAPRLNTDIVRPSADQETRLSPYLTIPPGLSPTTLLDSPVFLSNSLVQPSPTTGKFQFAPNGDGNGNGNGRSSMMFSDSSSKNKDNIYEEFNGSSFAFKPPAPDPAPISHNPANPPFMSWQSFPSVEVSEHPFPPQNIEPDKVQSQNGASFSHFSFASAENRAQIGTFQGANGNAAAERSTDEDANVNSAPSDDGYNWRKYGQKQVKGSEFPRSYYKCTHPNCPVKKKVERSHEGHITEIIYKGAHNHPKPPPNRRSGGGSSSALCDMDEHGVAGADGDPVWTTNMQQKGLADSGHDGNLEPTSSTVDGSTTFSNEEEEDDRGTHGSVSLVYEGEGDESESKRRKVEAYAADVSGATRAVREPRVVVQTTSEVDILDDGYRWRKYGQKVVKGNPNPRSYYKCTSAGCTVRKHVERASHDLKSVITTYEGKHNHDVPAARNTGHMASQAQSVQPQVHRPEPSQIQTNMARFERAHFGFHGQQQQQMGPTHGAYGYGMNLVGAGGLGHMAMAGLGPNQRSALPVHQYLGQVQACQPNDMGMMLPKGEPKVEPGSDPGANGSSIYHHQIMNRLPLGPQM